MNPKKKDFDYSMHYMRGVAIVLIMLTHTAYGYTSD